MKNLKVYHHINDFDAGWSSPVARWAHNPKVAGSNPAPATKFSKEARLYRLAFFVPSQTDDSGNRRSRIAPKRSGEI